jgi:hypothetical protein
MSDTPPTEASPDPAAEAPAPSAPPPGTAPDPDAAAAGTVPLDADDTRGAHFSRLIRSPATIILGAILVVGTGLALLAAVSPAIGGAGAGAAVLVVLLVVWLVASNQAESDFFKAYASGRSLRLVDGRGSVPPATPLLQRGDARYTQRQLLGALPGGEPGCLAHYTYEDTTTDSEGNRSTTYIHFTIVMCDLPQFAPFMAELYAQRRVGFRFLDGAEDVFRKRQRVEQESEVVDKAYEIFCGPNDDMNRARQVLSPQFLVWLGDNAPQQFAFECVAGALVCNVKGHKKSAAELDAVCESASAIARRLREEAME